MLVSVASGKSANEVAVVMPRGPGQVWTVESIVALGPKLVAGRDYNEGLRAYRAAQCAQALRHGVDLVQGLPGNVLLLGEMGIGNTTSAAALLAAATGLAIGLSVVCVMLCLRHDYSSERSMIAGQSIGDTTSLPR
jgi:hypothetical protein